MEGIPIMEPFPLRPLGTSFRGARVCREPYEEARAKAAYNAARQELAEGVGKRSCYGIDLGIVRYDVERTSVKKEVVAASKDAPKPVWGKRYIAICFCDNFDEKESPAFVSQKEAEAWLKKMAERGDIYRGIIEHRMVITNGVSVKKASFSFSKEVKSYKKLPSRLPAKATVREIHRYLFYGVAAE